MVTSLEQSTAVDTKECRAIGGVGLFLALLSVLFSVDYALSSARHYHNALDVTML